jgi:hypothetical protein
MAKKRKAPPPPADDDAPGWHAIDAACAQLYPDQTNPLHVASVPHPPLGGDGLIYGISAYRAEGPPRHWHFVTYGFSELYAKESDDPKVSGWGFELTFRLTRAPREKQPPNWAFSFLMNLGRYVRRSRNPFGAGHNMNLNGPIALGSATAIRAITFATDPQLGAIDTPNGRVEFLQVVGITLDELDACSDWQSDRVRELLLEHNPLLVTDLGRASIREDAATAARIDAGIDGEGSQSDRAFVAVVEWSTTKRPRRAAITLGAKGALALLPKLRSRLAHGRDFALVGPEKVVVFRAAEKFGWEADEGVLALDLSPKALAALRAGLRAARGAYNWPELPGLTLTVRPSEIADAEGKVVEVIG